MPELPEIQAHAERLDRELSGRTFERLDLISFTALKTATPDPGIAVGHPVSRVRRRGKYLALEVGPLTFVIHLMQGGRLRPDTKLTARPRNGRARLRFGPVLGTNDPATGHVAADTTWNDCSPSGGPSTPGPVVERHHDPAAPLAVLLTETGTERRAGIWCVPTGEVPTAPPLADLGPESDRLDTEQLLDRLGSRNQRLHGALRDQRVVAGLGRRLANEVCHRAGLSPFAMTGRLSTEEVERVRAAIHEAIDEGLAAERARGDMSASADRPGRVHGRTGSPCPVCGDTIRSVEYSGYRIDYCPACQTGGKVLADNTTSRFLK